VQWVEQLPWVLLGIRAQPKKDSNMSFTELVYGNPLTLPGEAPSQEIVDRIRSAVTSFNPLRVREPPHQRGKASMLEALQQAHTCTCCWGRLFPLWPLGNQGPYLVLQKGSKCFRLATGASDETISVDRIKPHYGTAPVTVEQPPCRGCPAAEVKTPELQGAVISKSHT
jgi:hypothetical protein